jgi:hypothetical protein
MNDQVKGLLQSKTFWGGVLVLVAVLFPSLKLTDADQSSLVETIGTIVGGVLAIIGRIVAVQPVAGLWRKQAG